MTELSEKLPQIDYDGTRYPYGSPMMERHHQDIPRYYYHVGEGSPNTAIKSYKIRETEAADSFGKGYSKNKYVWLSSKPIYATDNYFIVDITKLDNNDLRYTGQAEGHLLHKGNIPAEAIVGYHGKVLGPKSTRDIIVTKSYSTVQKTKHKVQKALSPIAKSLRLKKGKKS